MAVSRLGSTTLALSRNATGDWERPADWLPMPTLTLGDQRVNALVFVYPNDRNIIGFIMNGNYTVDWGDGTTANFVSGVLAQKTYTYSSLPANTQTSDGARQAMVVITPQAGQNLTLVDFRATLTGVPSGYFQPFRDIGMVAPFLTGLGLSTTTVRNATRWFTFLGTAGAINPVNNFAGLLHIRGFTGTEWTRNINDWTNGIAPGATNLVTVPLWETQNCTNFSSFLSGCTSLRNVPNFNTSNGVIFSSMFQGCTNLQTAPSLDTAKATNMSAMFASCTAMTAPPTFSNTSLVTNMSQLFSGCSLLTAPPAMDTGNVTNMSNVFNACSSLTSVPLYNTIKVVDINSMFAGCSAMKALPAFDFSAVTTAGTFAQNCSSLASVGPYLTNLCASWNTTFNSCISLRTVDLGMAAIPNTAALNNVFIAVPALTSVKLNGLRYAPPSLANQSMNATALNELYTSLGTAVGAQTLTVTGNPGSGTSTPSIATAKGWTVVGG